MTTIKPLIWVNKITGQFQKRPEKELDATILLAQASAQLVEAQAARQKQAERTRILEQTPRLYEMWDDDRVEKRITAQTEEAKYFREKNTAYTVASKYRLSALKTAPFYAASQILRQDIQRVWNRISRKS